MLIWFPGLLSLRATLSMMLSDVALFVFMALAKPSVMALVLGVLLYIGFRRMSGRPFDWPITVAALTLPVAAVLILLTAHPTRHGTAMLDMSSNFLALEAGCWALDAAFVCAWSAAWLLLPNDRSLRRSPWKIAVATGAGVLCVGIMVALLPLQGKPSW
jgi:hypothetical protein